MDTLKFLYYRAGFYSIYNLCEQLINYVNTNSPIEVFKVGFNFVSNWRKQATDVINRGEEKWIFCNANLNTNIFLQNSYFSFVII